MSGLTNEDREALLAAVRSCRVDDDAPVRLIRAGDEGHVAFMVGEAVEQIVARHAAEARAAALNEAAADFRENAARVWGYDAAWLTTGRKVANLAADWLAREADDMTPAP